jgi:antitoxin component HigA of HigAB toxin-antitoxin module
VPISEEDFTACLEQVKQHVNQDLFDINQPPDIVAKLYLMETYNEKRSRLSVIGKTRILTGYPN